MNIHNSAHSVVLADIGGTNARFALADPTQNNPLLLDSIQSYAVKEFASLSDAANAYLQEKNVTVKHAVFAVAGRVDGDNARITNHSWVINRPRLCREVELDSVELVNDFAAQSMAVTLLQAADIEVVGSPQWQPDHLADNQIYAVIGPGTGLGVSLLIMRDGKAWPIETEGGHVSFPPGTPEEIEILKLLSLQFGRVSNERLVCGPGLVNIHRALAQLSNRDPGPLEPADITQAASNGDPLCMRSVDIFCAIFGAISGDLVLTSGAWSGVFLCGGLVPKMLDSIKHSGFRQRFENKGRFSANLAQVPTIAVLHPHAGLLGAAAIATQHYHNTIDHVQQ